MTDITMQTALTFAVDYLSRQGSVTLPVLARIMVAQLGAERARTLARAIAGSVEIEAKDMTNAD